MSFQDPLKYLSKTIPDLPALVDSSNLITFDHFNHMVNILAANLLEKGVSKSNRVIIVSTNCIEFPLVIYALFRIGAVACLFSPRYPESMKATLSNDLDCEYQIVLDDKDTLPGLIIFNFTELTEKSLNKFQTIGDISPELPAVVSFTSGSSGKPKAVLHTFGSLYSNAQGSNKNISFVDGDRWLLSLPLFHVGGLGILFRSFVGGGTVIISDPGEDFIPLIKNHAITHLSLVPTQLLRLLASGSKKELANLRLKALLVGGGMLSDTLAENAHAIGLPLYRSYGLTEMGSQVATSPEPGRPMCLLANCQMDISDKNEILVKGNSLFSGYLIQSKLDSSLNKNGWYETGDCGEIDRSGNLHIHGRRDNMIISGGENIHPESIEKALLKIKTVTNAIVLPVVDKEYGQRPVAFLDLNVPFDKKEIVNCLKKLIPSYSIPIRFYKWPDKINQAGIKNDRQFFKRLLLNDSELNQL